MSSAESISVVVPAFNEEATVWKVLDEIVRALEAYPADWEALVVDDGSTDRTAELVEQFAAGRDTIRLARHGCNYGSGQAIWTGLGRATKDLVIYVPADGQFDPAEIPEYAAAARDADIVLGVRRSRDDYSPLRRVQSVAFLQLVNLLFRQSYRDVNWVHLWRRTSVLVLKPRARGVFLMQEVISLGRDQGLRIVENDSRYRPRRAGTTKVSRPTVVLETLLEMGLHIAREALR